MELVRWQRNAVRRRQQIAAEMLDGIPYQAHSESLHVWLPLGEERSEQAFVAQARLQGVAIAPGASFATAPTVRHSAVRSEEHTSELQSLMRISYAVFCL